MTRADQLRQALDVGFDLTAAASMNAEDFLLERKDVETVLDAARFALRVWEGDQQLVEKVAAALLEWDERSLDGLIGSWAVEVKAPYLAEARAVLAAIGEEEQ